MNGLFSNVVFIKDMEEYQSIQIIVKPVNLKKNTLQLQSWQIPKILIQLKCTILFMYFISLLN